MIQAIIVLALFFLVGLGGCTTPEKRKAEAEAQISEEKANIMKEYKNCLKKYEGQEDVSKKCAHYKEASEAFISK